MPSRGGHRHRATAIEVDGLYLQDFVSRPTPCTADDQGGASLGIDVQPECTLPVAVAVSGADRDGTGCIGGILRLKG